MRRILLLLGILFLFQAPLEAQILEKVKRRAKQEKSKAEDEVVDELFKKKKKKGKEKDGESGEPGAGEDGESGSSEGAGEVEPDKKVWMARYDFKPGKEIIFFDDFEGEDLGEIPSKWFYNKGLMEVIQMDDEHNKVMSGDLGYGYPNFKKGYTLPEAYTIEYDIFVADPSGGREKGFGSYGYHMYFYGADKRKSLAHIDVGAGSIEYRGKTGGKLPGVTHADLANTWNHISISVNGNSIKAYFNDYRMFNSRMAPDAKPVLFTMWNCCQTTDKPVFMIDNFKVAAGAHPKYREELVNGKIVTNNIHFETGSAKLLPRSYAEIKRVVDIMKERSDLRFSVEGHTDDVGQDDYNQKLSEDRARSVVKAMEEMGIDADRLSSKGHGEAKPVADNGSPEGKASNRRVEFVVET